jgi:hypothetical protein
MKNNLFILFASLVILALVVFAATQVYLSKTSEFSRTPASTTSP